MSKESKPDMVPRQIVDKLLGRVASAVGTLETTPRAPQFADHPYAAQGKAIHDVREFLKAALHDATWAMAKSGE